MGGRDAWVAHSPRAGLAERTRSVSPRDAEAITATELVRGPITRPPTTQQRRRRHTELCARLPGNSLAIRLDGRSGQIGRRRPPNARIRNSQTWRGRRYRNRSPTPITIQTHIGISTSDAADAVLLSFPRPSNVARPRVNGAAFTRTREAAQVYAAAWIFLLERRELRAGCHAGLT
jgi:hypothetical protein